MEEVLVLSLQIPATVRLSPGCAWYAQYALRISLGSVQACSQSRHQTVTTVRCCQVESLRTNIYGPFPLRTLIPTLQINEWNIKGGSRNNNKLPTVFLFCAVGCNGRREGSLKARLDGQFSSGTEHVRHQLKLQRDGPQVKRKPPLCAAHGCPMMGDMRHCLHIAGAILGMQSDRARAW